MPLTGSTRVELDLWASVPATMAVELALLSIGVGLYTRATRARDRSGSVGLWSLVGFLLVVYVAKALGPPPPSATAVAWSAEAMWLLVVWGYWIDAHRAPVVYS